MTLANPEYLYLGIFIILLCALAAYSLVRRKKMLSLFGNPNTLKDITLRYSKKLRIAIFLLIVLSLIFLVLMIARPQRGLVESEDTSSGIEAVIMVDVSNSMLAADVSPNRLERSKFLLSSLIDKMTGDRIALGIFAGEAYLQVPITPDRNAVKSILASLSPTMISSQGTNIVAALETANRSFTEKTDADKAIILLTDGENHEGDVREIADEIASSGKKLFVLGIGTPQGAVVPTSNGPLLDEDGNTVISRLDEKLCSEVAQLAQGEYIHVDNTYAAQTKLTAALSSLKKSSDTTKYTTYDERFQVFGIISLILLVLSLIMPEHPLRRTKKKVGAIVVTLLFLLASASQPLSAQTSSWRLLHGANRQFDKGNYTEALSRYESILAKDPTNARALFNAANASLAMGDASKAEQLYTSAAQIEQNSEIKSRSYHNLGVISQTAALKADENTRQQLLRQAIAHYKNALRNNPSDDGARYNLQLCKKQLKEGEDNKNEDKKNKQQQEQRQQQQQQQQQSESQPDRQQQENTAQQQLLNLTRQAEKKTQDKINAAKPQRKSKEKNW